MVKLITECRESVSQGQRLKGKEEPMERTLCLNLRRMIQRHSVLFSENPMQDQGASFSFLSGHILVTQPLC